MNKSAYYSLPRQYRQSGFWRFVLDTKAPPEDIPEPRFRQFAENLRNYVASGAVLKVGFTLYHSSHRSRHTVFSIVLIAVGIIATCLSEAQLFGLSIVLMHFHVDFSFLYKKSRGLELIAGAFKLALLLALPIFLLVAMWLFVTSDVPLFAKT